MVDKDIVEQDIATATADGALVGTEGGKYEANQVQVLRDAAHIRRRPGAYIGDTTSHGLHHLVYELVYNSVDEALAGFCKNIHVKIDVDGSLSVSDDGRGIPVDEHPDEKRPTLEVVMTKTGAGAKFDKRTYKTSAGLHGMGAKAVTALSISVEAEVRRNGRVYMQRYSRGVPTSPVEEIGSAGKTTGTTVRFMPDPQIFKDAAFSYDTLESRLRELAFLNKGLTFKLTDARNGKEEVFRYAGGIGEFVAYLNRVEETISPVVYIDKQVDDVRVEVALQYTTSEQERVRCYTNNANNSVGGTHLSGFRAALTRTLNAYGYKENKFKNDLSPIGEDFREGITAVVSVQVPEPQFESNNKLRLNNPEVEGIVSSVVGEQLAKFLEENPKDAKRIMDKVVLAAQAREAASKAKKALKERKSILSGGGLPGKLLDCTSRDRDESELFLVEGLSAGGTADSGRDRKFQAVLPLRGKVLNVEKARVEKVLGNEEICNLISVLGIDIGNSEDLGGLRYGKVIILTDADVDGQHIRTLLLTFFYRQMRRLIEEGHILVARPPLYKVVDRKHVRFVQTAEEMDRELLERGLRGPKLLLLDPTGTDVKATLEGDRLARLLQILSEVEKELLILERRGLTLETLLPYARDGKLPTFRVLLGTEMHWFASAEAVDKFRLEQQQKHDLLIAEELHLGPAAPPKTNGNGNGNGGVTFFEQELHEVQAINEALDGLREFGLGAADLMPAPRVAGREPAPRYFLEKDDHRQSLAHLRELPPKIRDFGQRGLSVTRFKGLGEMEDHELWETTLDPEKRTLMRVKFEDALKAEEMFRVLMGEKVEPRREFIQKHALEVKEIDYHGA
jgi:DNA gyrase subunit B